MENVVLTVHLILALLLIGVVLLQRSEGGGLGLGGGGGGVMTGRQAANALSRATWMLATGFLITSIALTVIAARNSAGVSVVDRLGGSTAPATPAPATGLPTLPTYAPPPGSGQPVLPPGAAAPVTPAAPASTAPATT
ncbi:preprotein translocase subunit SecG, partial [Paracoccus sanguinis]|uniref:preprotein translocase subunit SecG n=1 Tax=Paracoccus sanguinis TaxID=1545044 RepID=UPI000698B8DB